MYRDSLWELSHVPELIPLMEPYLTTVEKRTGTEIVAAFMDTVIPLQKHYRKVGLSLLKVSYIMYLHVNLVTQADRHYVPLGHAKLEFC